MKRITMAMVQRRLIRLKEIYGPPWEKLSLDYSNNGIKLVRHEKIGERNISPRGTARQVYDFLESYRAGYEWGISVESRNNREGE